MKHFFKYEKGYINIDDHYLFMTKTGNWSETDSLFEKSAKAKSQNAAKKVKTYSFYAMIVAVSLLFFFNMNGGKNNKIMLFGGIVLFVLAAFNYIRSSSGKQYKIPLTKITKMELIKKDINIHFHNLDNKEDFEKIENIEEKGIQILKDLKLIK